MVSTAWCAIILTAIRKAGVFTLNNTGPQDERQALNSGLGSIC